jgi:hypothetical protein
MDAPTTHDEPERCVPKEVLFAGVDGLLAALAAVCATGGALLRVAEEMVPPPGWLPGPVWVVLSLTAPVASGICIARVRPNSKVTRGLGVLGRSAGLILIIATASAIASCALALGPEPVFFVFFGVPFLFPLGLASVALSPGRRVARAFMATACLGLCASLLTSWPLRLTTWFWRADLADLAARVRGGTAPTSAWVGPFRFHGLEERDDVVLLVTDPGWAGFTGLADRPDEDLWQRCNLWSAYSVGGGWSLAFED